MNGNHGKLPYLTSQQDMHIKTTVRNRSLNHTNTELLYKQVTVLSVVWSTEFTVGKKWDKFVISFKYGKNMWSLKKKSENAGIH